MMRPSYNIASPLKPVIFFFFCLQVDGDSHWKVTSWVMAAITSWLILYAFLVVRAKEMT